MTSNPMAGHYWITVKPSPLVVDYSPQGPPPPPPWWAQVIEYLKVLYR